MFWFDVDFCTVSTVCVFQYLSKVLVTEWTSIGEIDAHSALDMFT